MGGRHRTHSSVYVPLEIALNSVGDPSVGVAEDAAVCESWTLESEIGSFGGLDDVVSVAEEKVRENMEMRSARRI